MGSVYFFYGVFLCQTESQGLTTAALISLLISAYYKRNNTSQSDHNLWHVQKRILNVVVFFINKQKNPTHYHSCISCLDS